MHTPSRRRFLQQAAGVVTAASVAGCQDRPPSLTPHLPAAYIQEGGWHQIDEVEEQASEEIDVAGTTQQVDVEAKARVFENTNPLQQLAERLEFDPTRITLPAESFVAAKAWIDPPHVRLLARSDAVRRRAIDAAELQAKHKLREYGFTNIRRIEEGRLDIRSGPTAMHRLYRADYPYESSSLSYDEQSVTIESGVMTVEAQLAVWLSGGLLITGAGVYPGESGELVASAFGATRELALGFEPERYREEVRELITLVS